MIESRKQSFFFVLLIAGGVAVRLVLTLIAGNKLVTPWRVGGDAEFFVRLASNVAQGMGYTYAHQSTAFRPPLYPFVLAGMMTIFGNYYALATRVLQFAVGLVTVWFCGATATKVFGAAAGRATLLLALYFPTLSVFPTELETECFATFLAAAFFWLVIDNSQWSERTSAAALGLIAGLASLVRFNMEILLPIAAWVLIRKGPLRQTWRNVAVLALVFGAVIAPWLIRNEVAFGHPMFSTAGGYNALLGVVTGQGRVQPGDEPKLLAAGVWQLGNLETNGPERLTLPSEPELNRRSWQLAVNIWREKTWRLTPLMLAKLGRFWLSTEQLLATSAFPWRIRLTRGFGVILYWILLGLTIVGWTQLRHQRPGLAYSFLAYAVLMTAAHLPFPMTSRHRIPFAEPLLVFLGGSGCVWVWNHLRLTSPLPVGFDAGPAKNQEKLPC